MTNGFYESRALLLFADMIARMTYQRFAANAMNQKEVARVQI